MTTLQAGYLTANTVSSSLSLAGVTAATFDAKAQACSAAPRRTAPAPHRAAPRRTAPHCTASHGTE